MAHRLLTEPGGVAVVIGEAGTGKTYALMAAAEGWAQAGTQMRACAPTWRAAGVLRSEGLEAQSVASLLAELDCAALGGGPALPYASVLVVDEAGMVSSADLARLLAHVEQADGKLVLIGDPEQLGEIEAGGLFRGLAERTETIHLEEVIRHEHDLDREAAARIRAGEGREALRLYQAGERVTVAPDAATRRETMVADWHQSFARGEDAVMLARRNVDVERLNQMAREVRMGAGALGAAEIEVGGARFAAGDQVITRVNDRSASIYNRERWQIQAVDPEKGTALLAGKDAERTVEVGPEYLARTNPYNDAPALQHAYAVTTYSAQGSTFDRAFVMADPSMDKQELYVATSRSRGETRLYATPEVRAEREEIAPADVELRVDLSHLADASERDRAQLAAHDLALEDELSSLPAAELLARHEELRSAASDEADLARPRKQLEGTITEVRETLAEREGEWRAEVARSPQGSERLDQIETRLGASEAHLARFEADLAQMRDPGEAARREFAVADRALAQWRALEHAAARLDPPRYISAELGERPRDTEKAAKWDKGLAQIERYRRENGVTDKHRAFGSEPSRAADRDRRQRAMERLARVQRSLGRERQARALTRDLGRGFGR